MQKILFHNKFIICLYMFRALCAQHQEVKIVLYCIWYHHTCRWPFRAHLCKNPSMQFFFRLFWWRPHPGSLSVSLLSCDDGPFCMRR